MAILTDKIGGGFSATVGNSFQQQACSYRLIFTDTTTVNDNTYNKWTVSYRLNLNIGSTFLGSSAQGGRVIYDFCREGIFSITQNIKIYDDDCTTLLYEEEITDNVDVDEVFPVLELPAVDCCYPINTQLTITPANIALNNNQCETTPIANAGFIGEQEITVQRTLDTTAIQQNGIYVRFFSTNNRADVGGTVEFFQLGADLQNYEGTKYTITAVNNDWFEIEETFYTGTPIDNAYVEITDTGGFAGSFQEYNGTEQILAYVLYEYDLDTGTYLQSNNNQTYAITSTSGTDYPFIFTPTELTRYKLEASITNCCQKKTKEVEFVVCDAITVERACKGVVECNECYTYNIYNYTESNINISIKDLIVDKDIHTVTVEANSKYSHIFTEDSVYSITYTNPDSEEVNVIIFAVFCDIDKCYTDLLKLQLCNNVDTKDCCDDRYLDNRLANIQALYQTYLHKVEKYTDLNLRFAQSDVTNKLDDFQRIGKIRDQLLTFCKKCRRHCNGCFELTNGNCI